MSGRDQTGSSIAALRQRRAELADRHNAIVDADRVLAEAVAGAHQALQDSVRRLDAIADEIERGRALAVDTPLGAREFQLFLLAKQREISVIVTEAQQVSRAKSAVLQRLQQQYSI